MKGIDLKKKNVTGDAAMERVIAAQAKIQELQREVRALRTDRDQLLEEYQDALNARPVPVSPTASKKSVGGTRLRVVAGDLHGMRMDPAAARSFLDDVKVLRPDEVVLGGDMLEVGGWLAKHQPVGFVAETDYSYQEDIAATNWFLDELQVAAPKAVIHYLEGNHEDRVERWAVDQTRAHQREAGYLYEAFAPRSLLRLSERGISYYHRGNVYVEGLPRGWIELDGMYFVHELGRGKNAARDALHQAAGDVTYFHTHRADTSTDVFPRTGLVHAYNPGCLCKMQPMWMHSKPTGWSQGYAIDIIDADGDNTHLQIPIWRGKSHLEPILQQLGKVGQGANK